jgi:hypothetical protein
MNNLIDINKAMDVFKNGAYLAPVAKPYDKKSPPYQIRWNGDIVRLGNGKCVWPTLGAAKCALRQKIDENKLIELAYLDKSRLQFATGYNAYKYYSRNDKDMVYNMVLDELQKQGILKFEPKI